MPGEQPTPAAFTRRTILPNSIDRPVAIDARQEKVDRFIRWVDGYFGALEQVLTVGGAINSMNGDIISGIGEIITYHPGMTWTDLSREHPSVLQLESDLDIGDRARYMVFPTGILNNPNCKIASSQGLTSDADVIAIGKRGSKKQGDFSGSLNVIIDAIDAVRKDILGAEVTLIIVVTTQGSMYYEQRDQLIPFLKKTPKSLPVKLMLLEKLREMHARANQQPPQQ